jgi:hypothetical protein
MRNILPLVEARKQTGVQTGKDAATLANQMAPIKLACPVCEKVYDTEAEAIECRDQPYDDGGLTVGTIVVLPSKWTTWYNPTDPWVAFTVPADPSNESHFRHDSQFVPYYVVTAIHGEERDPHRCIVTLSSLVSGVLSVGWNSATGEGHYAMYRLDGGKHCRPWPAWRTEIGPYLEGLQPPDQVVEEAARLARLGISTWNLI